MEAVIMYFLVALIIVCVFAIGYIYVYNYFQTFIIRLNEAEAFIDTTLRKRFDLLNKSIHIIENHCDKEEKVLPAISKLRSQKLNNFDLDRQLYEAINEFEKYKNLIPELNEDDAFLKIDLALFESEAEIVAARKYYNDIISDYNKLVRNFPSNIVAIVSKYKEKPYFDGKNMYDDDTNDFKL